VSIFRRRTPEELAERERARLLAGTTRRLELPVPPDQALGLIKEAVKRREPAMKLQRSTSESAVVTVAGGAMGIPGLSGNLSAASTLIGGGMGVPVTWVPFGEGTQYIATARSIGEMYLLRSEIQSLWRALIDAWDARERWEAQKKR
jgi:hypothetical protein